MSNIPDTQAANFSISELKTKATLPRRIFRKLVHFFPITSF